MAILLATLLIIFVYSLWYLVVSGIVWLICWAAGLTFTWKLSLIVFLVILLLRIAVGGRE